MKKMKLAGLATAVFMFAAMMTACGNAKATNVTTEQATEATTESAAETVTTTAAPETTVASTAAAETATDEAMRVGSLKGPTTMGLVNLMKASESGTSEGKYQFKMETQPDQILAGLVSGDLDVALIPANMASVAYNKTKHGVSVIDINTLGVLYIVSGDETIKNMKDLSGKTVLSTGQGASPEYVLNYLLSSNNVTDCNVQFMSEATEIAAKLKEDSSLVALLPQPFVTAACAQNPDLKVAFSLNDAWNEVSADSKLLTGVTVVRNDYLKNHTDQVATFLKEHASSTEKANADVAETAKLVAEYGIIEKAPVAEKALPNCSIVCLTGNDMKSALSGYLNVLYQANPKSVGGNLPENDFYFIG